MNGYRSVLFRALAALALFTIPQAAHAQAAQEPKPSLEVYGFAMLDIGHDFKTIHPDWYDTMRVTKLPTFDGEFGKGNDTFAGVRQSRFGVRSATPTDLGELKTIFEFEMFGTGVDAGQTTIRLRHAWGELKHFGAGQTWSTFMDPDVFPNQLEYWGPTGMVFFRNVQARWMPVQNDKHSLWIAVERPGASGDQGTYADRVELSGIQARFPLPDFTFAYKVNQKWGYGRVAGIYRRISWDDTNADDFFDFSDHARGWGINLSSNVKPSAKDVVRFQFVFGEGIQNYMNDSPVDIGVQSRPVVSPPVPTEPPIEGTPLGIVGLVAFVDHQWSPKYSTTVGYSWQDIDNSDGQAPNAFKTGHYALGNVMVYPVPNVMFGPEFQWGRRVNFSDGFESDGFKLQFSFKYNFSWKLGG